MTRSPQAWIQLQSPSASPALRCAKLSFGTRSDVESSLILSESLSKLLRLSKPEISSLKNEVTLITRACCVKPDAICTKSGTKKVLHKWYLPLFFPTKANPQKQTRKTRVLGRGGWQVSNTRESRQALQPERYRLLLQVIHIFADSSGPSKGQKVTVKT